MSANAIAATAPLDRHQPATTYRRQVSAPLDALAPEVRCASCGSAAFWRESHETVWHCTWCEPMDEPHTRQSRGIRIGQARGSFIGDVA